MPAGTIFAAALFVPCLSSAQSQCDQVRAHVERLRQHVDQQRTRGVPREQLNSDIEIYNRWVSAYSRSCSGGGSVAGTGGLSPGGRQQTLQQLERVLGVIASMNSGESIRVEPDWTEQAQAEMEARQIREKEEARRRTAISNPFAVSQFTTTLVDTKVPEVKGPCDTRGLNPSVSPECMATRNPFAGPAGSAQQPGTATNPFAPRDAGSVPGSQREINVQATQSPVKPFGSAANNYGVSGQDEGSSRAAGGQVSSGVGGKNMRPGDVSATDAAELPQQKVSRRVKGMCPLPPSGGNINFELLTDRGTLLCDYGVRGSFCLSFGRDKVKYYSGGVSTKTDRDPPVRCTLEFPA